ncbi:MAG: HAD family hydrolase [Roseburia sp.]|nr:HAD family hydrolase [Anaeroplasma bactoclasticum]MCM1196967.1 HAD family hydrolase [Roseburia sp.]MCM1557647.1 HAD family hydrolase [Anaeroplasma bactoclasticum]
MIKAILFDMDGTLLPMDINKFTSRYFEEIGKYMYSYGYNPKELIKAIWMGTEAMVKNNGIQSNEDVFWKTFSSLIGFDASFDIPLFTSFYMEKFDEIKSSCGYTEDASKLIEYLKEKKLELILATNPLFPLIAQTKRLAWAGIKDENFSWITSYENSHYCKPNLKYYEEILSHFPYSPNECLMIGNDVLEDMVAQKLGMQVFLLTDCLINKDNVDISVFPHGDYKALFCYLEKEIFI